MYRIIGADQNEYGPVSAAEVERWIAQGRANAQSVAQSESMPGWKPLGDFPEFTTAFATVARAPSPFPIQPVGSYARPRTNGMAVTGFVFSLVSFLCCCFGILPSILGLIFSGVGLVQTSRDPMQSGRGLAIAGIILSILGLFVSGLGILIWLLGLTAQPH